VASRAFAFADTFADANAPIVRIEIKVEVVIEVEIEVLVFPLRLGFRDPLFQPILRLERALLGTSLRLRDALLHFLTTHLDLEWILIRHRSSSRNDGAGNGNSNRSNGGRRC